VEAGGAAECSVQAVQSLLPRVVLNVLLGQGLHRYGEERW
jgi:hypothetical protein